MRKPKLFDYLLLTILSLIWASAFFNIKIATYSFGPITIGFLRSLLGAMPVLILCFYKNIKIEAFSKDWKWFAIIGLVNLAIPFMLISYGVNYVQSNLAAILMSTTPLSSTVLAHFFFLKGEKFNLLKTIGLLIGFSGIVFLFSDNFLINENNFIAALLILLGSTCYVIGGVITLKISDKQNENVTGSILIWSTIILFSIYRNFRETLDVEPFNRLNYIGYIFRNISYRHSMVIEVQNFKDKWSNISFTSFIHNTNFWNYFRIHIFK